PLSSSYKLQRISTRSALWERSHFWKNARVCRPRTITSFASIGEMSMQSSSLLFRLSIAFVVAVAFAGPAVAQFPPLDFSQADQEIYEFVGQVKNFPSAGPGLPATSVQYGYISHVRGLDDSQIYLGGVTQYEASAFLTFYNDSVTEKVTNHGSLKIVIRE